MNHIKLNMDDYRPRQRGCVLTEQEKINRLFDLAEKLDVCVGIERKRYGRNSGLLSKKP